MAAILLTDLAEHAISRIDPHRAHLTSHLHLANAGPLSDRPKTVFSLLLVLCGRAILNFDRDGTDVELNLARFDDRRGRHQWYGV